MQNLDLSSKEIMWKKLSTVPELNPYLDYDLLSMRFKLKQYMNLSDEDIDKIFDLYVDDK